MDRGYPAFLIYQIIMKKLKDQGRRMKPGRDGFTNKYQSFIQGMEVRWKANFICNEEIDDAKRNLFTGKSRRMISNLLQTITRSLFRLVMGFVDNMDYSRFSEIENRIEEM